MTATEILKTVNEVQSLVGFYYHGRPGNIDPYYSREKGYSWLLYFDGTEKLVHHPEDVLNTPFLNGKTLEEAASELTDIEW